MTKALVVHLCRRFSKYLGPFLSILAVSCSGSQYPYGPLRAAPLSWKGDFISFHYPTGWLISTETTGEYGTILLRPETALRPGVEPLIYVEYYQSEDSPEEAARYYERLATNEPSPQPVDVKHWKMKISGLPARVIAYSWLPHDEILDSDPAEVYEIRAFVRYDSFLVKIGYHVESGAEHLYKPDFEAVLSTLTFKPLDSD